ncbi:Oxygen-independent coproporphyrinogen-III oxidase-like protein YggW [Buchnera aphidicola (Cinara kochiana kochiana)]|uniref:Heme chaperone HemW n=1 Tax=Buchnera aphidicola (Cinara kochiana kochiana) TaxID=2518976 RepID=A0A451D644_9GAMM|nr:radical SAM family heme chaperone HemW [Buchnera aphidicola]VFP81267.1 Oxygen-independent coproporphyrinogen-III oxidase-like protein YggW [Buchnera aphidicola (Cinara kochiana kochiana)]
MPNKKLHILPPISLYIHIPWCIKKCPYCDFHSYKYSQKISEKKYIKHIIKDLKNDKKMISNRSIESIFIGGGTPSLLKSKTFLYLLKKIKKIISISKKTEISIEINPDINKKNKLIEYYEAGINRFSIGVQTFNEIILKKIERKYNAKKTIQLINSINHIPHKNLNIDLMYGLPEQTIQNVLEDLYQAITLKPEHISWYQLNIEPNTKFYTQNINLPSLQITKNMRLKGNKLLKKYGYIQYEISSYSLKEKYQCRHNLNYWNFGDYIGVGCGAHGKITQPNKTIIRTIKAKHDTTYISKKYIEKKYIVLNKDIPFEFFLNKFRLFQPIYYQDFENQTYIKKNKIYKKMTIAIKKGYLRKTTDSWFVTDNGREKLNSLLSIFL